MKNDTSAGARGLAELSNAEVLAQLSECFQRFSTAFRFWDATRGPLPEKLGADLPQRQMFMHWALHRLRPTDLPKSMPDREQNWVRMKATVEGLGLYAGTLDLEGPVDPATLERVANLARDVVHLSTVLSAVLEAEQVRRVVKVRTDWEQRESAVLRTMLLLERRGEPRPSMGDVSREARHLGVLDHFPDAPPLSDHVVGDTWKRLQDRGLVNTFPGRNGGGALTDNGRLRAVEEEAETK